MSMVTLTCRLHPALHWDTKEQAVNANGRFNYSRHIFYDHQGVECDCDPMFLIKEEMYLAESEEQKAAAIDHIFEVINVAPTDHIFEVIGKALAYEEQAKQPAYTGDLDKDYPEFGQDRF